jgi:hypothetical protein
LNRKEREERKEKQRPFYKNNQAWFLTKKAFALFAFFAVKPHLSEVRWASLH